MDTVRVMHDREGQTLAIWFGDSTLEVTASPTDDGVVVMKDATGRVIGVEILGFTGRPTSAILKHAGAKAEI